MGFRGLNCLSSAQFAQHESGGTYIDHRYQKSKKAKDMEGQEEEFDFRQVSTGESVDDDG